MSRARPGDASRIESMPATDDPLGELERELVAAARRRSGAAGTAPRREAEAFSGVLAVASAVFAVILAVGVILLLLGGH